MRHDEKEWVLERIRKRVRERMYGKNNLFIGQTRRMKPLPPPLIEIKEGEI